MATTDDTPTRVALMPDWREGVRLVQEFSSTVQTGRFGLEQRSRRRQRAIYSLDFVRNGLTAEESRGRLEGMQDEFRKVLTVPLWPDGIGLQADMAGPTVALLDSNPIDGEWLAPFDVYLWHDELGGEWRQCSAVVGRNLTLVGAGTLYPAGSWVFPSRKMVREAGEGMLGTVDLSSGSENPGYRTL